MKQSDMFNLDKWRFIDSGIADGQWNMAVDEVLLRALEHTSTPVLRLYRWEPYLSCGRFSDVASTLDTEALEDAKTGLVRRISGGGVLVHGDDLSYALAVPRSRMEGRGVNEHYREWCRFLIRFYEGLGLEAAFALTTSRTPQRSAACLANSEPYDLLIGGRKMGGNAQRHTRFGMVQHGSIPIGLDAVRFDPLFRVDSGIADAASLASTGCAAESSDLARRLKEAFCQTYGVELVEEGLSRSETDAAEALIRSRYGKRGWNIDARR